MIQYLHDNLELVLIIFTIVFSVIGSLTRLFNLKTKTQKKEEAVLAFNNTIEKLTSNNLAAQLSAAVHIRKFFSLPIKENGDKLLFKDALGVITGMLKVVQTGVFQKTLGDGLAYARNLSYVDIQKCNLQNIYLGIKSEKKLNENDTINLTKTDFYLSDLTEILIENASGPAIFYDSLLCNARIKYSDFSDADFRDTDLRGTTFINVHLRNANFKGAKNIPAAVRECLNDDMVFIKEGIFVDPEEVKKMKKKTAPKEIKIFISMPGTMLGSDEIKLEAWKTLLEQKLHCRVKMYTRDLYPQFGQLSNVRKSINDADAFVCFGTKQIHIVDAEYRPHSNESDVWKEKWLSTPWCEIETSMAFMKGLPILLLTNDDIDFGIFDRNITETQIQHIPMEENLRNVEKNASFRCWVDQIKRSQKMKLLTPTSEVIAKKLLLVTKMEELENEKLIDKTALQKVYDENNVLNEQYDFYDQIFEKDGKKGLKDIVGNILVQPKYTDISVRFIYESNRLCPVPVANSEGKYALVSTDGKDEHVTQFIYDIIGTIDFTPFYFAQKDSKLAVFNLNGREFIPCIIDKITDNFNGVIIFTSDGKYGLFTKKGLYVAPIYDNLIEKNELVYVCHDQHWGFLDEEGKFIAEGTDDKIVEHTKLLSLTSCLN